MPHGRTTRDRRSFAQVTEGTGTPVTVEGARMIQTRYVYAAGLSQGRRVLELACGSGQGLGLLAKKAAFCAGGDIDRRLLSSARSAYGSRVPLINLDGANLPFRSGSFDLLLLYEASYYMPDMGAVFDEITRVLEPGGVVVFVNANPERADFIRSPHSHSYLTANEFRVELSSRGFSVDVRGAFPTSTRGLLSAGIPVVRRLLEALRLTPRTLAGRARLKRWVYGPPVMLPSELEEGFAEIEPLAAVDAPTCHDYKVLYVTATAPR